jgi:hypothetical protein
MNKSCKKNENSKEYKQYLIYMILNKDHLFAEPMRMVLCATFCQYCGNPDADEQRVEYLYSIQACNIHMPLAKRDSDAWLHKNSCVRFKDIINEPLFTETNLLEIPIKMRRSNGEIQDDWILSRPSYDNSCHVKCENGVWYMCAESKARKLSKGLNLLDLKLVLHEEQHKLIDTFLTKLDSQIYKVAYEAFELAVEESAHTENPTSESVDTLVPKFTLVNINHPSLGIGRVLIPTNNDHLSTDPCM